MEESTNEKPLLKAAKELSKEMYAELDFLTFHGKNLNLATMHLLRRIGSALKPPSVSEFKKFQAAFPFLSRTQIVLSLLIQEEIRQRTTAYGDTQAAVEALIKQMKTDSVIFDEAKLQIQWNSLFGEKSDKKKKANKTKISRKSQPVLEKQRQKLRVTETKAVDTDAASIGMQTRRRRKLLELKVTPTEQKRKRRH